MRTDLDCYPCFVRQALAAARMAGASDSQQWGILQQTFVLLQDFELGATPPEIGTIK